MGSWVPQISAKKPGLVAQGRTFDSTSVLADFRSSGARYSDTSRSACPSWPRHASTSRRCAHFWPRVSHRSRWWTNHDACAAPTPGCALPDERALGEVHRRVLVADPDSQVLHLASPGSRASLRAGRVRVEKRGEVLGTVPVERVLALVLHGNIDVSSGLLRELLWRRTPVVWCSGTGRGIGRASPASGPNGGPRVRQHVASAAGHLGLARRFITAKIGNQATLLRRHGDAEPTVRELRDLQRRAAQANGLTELFGIEGDAAARYFAKFSTKLTDAVRNGGGIVFDGRSRRPALDPVNATLNFAYGMLLADVIRAVVACGLDRMRGSCTPVNATSRRSRWISARSSERRWPTPSSSAR